MESFITFDQLGNQYKYTCSITQSYLIFEKNKNYISLYDTHFNWDEPKFVLNLLNYAFQDIIKTNSNYFRYDIPVSELQYIDIDKWKQINKNNDIITLECDMENAYSNIIEGFLS